MAGITSGETLAVLLTLFILVKLFRQPEPHCQSDIYSYSARLWHHYIRLLCCSAPRLEFSKSCQSSAEGRVEPIKFLLCWKASFKVRKTCCFSFGTAAVIHLHQLSLPHFFVFFFNVIKVNFKYVFEVKLLDHSTTSAVQSVFIFRLLQASLNYGKSIFLLLFSLLCCRPICHCCMTA